jgi:hypothetical protein
LAGGHSDHHGTRRRITSQHRAGRDEGFLADDNTGSQHGAPADSATLSQHRRVQFEVGSVPAHRVVVGRDHARRHEHVILDHGAGGDIAVGLHAHTGPDCDVVLDARSTADRTVGCDRHTLAQLHLIADHRVVADA